MKKILLAFFLLIFSVSRTEASDWVPISKLSTKLFQALEQATRRAPDDERMGNAVCYQVIGENEIVLRFENGVSAGYTIDLKKLEGVGKKTDTALRSDEPYIEMNNARDFPFVWNTTDKPDDLSAETLRQADGMMEEAFRAEKINSDFMVWAGNRGNRYVSLFEDNVNRMTPDLISAFVGDYLTSELAGRARTEDTPDETDKMDFLRRFRNYIIGCKGSLVNYMQDTIKKYDPDLARELEEDAKNP